uniref:IML1 N-terminal double psi beta-barrel domain-containing protein n=1 Tax=Palpitomonas bilix TaxID=652834 RepID=A0A7S3D6K3_9EUKA|mmetsp:Transcript_24005/g.60801  ORF Transcript_24005/g.60801 Transcript_24005/m.60801 type:complete len:198 (+) Transcript_24005:177-770(+)
MDSKQDEPKIQPSLHLKLPDLFWSRVPSLDTRAHFVLDSAREGANFKKTVSLTVHNESFSTEELLINGKELPFVREGDVIELVPLDGKADGSRVALVKQSSLSSLKGVQCISISKQLADLFAVKPREEATVQLIRPDQVRTSIVTLSFRDQFLSRSDLFRLQGLLVGQCLYQVGEIRCSCGVYFEFFLSVRCAGSRI